ncbi:unnamed protein product [Nesidiocoris tenuis]|uniref:Uncharacterized protein n=1 Tax=Nesidiocoris tenuis TaxID=355587 RepID=A0A6H5HTL9_9HEMI|nr:unnamed protein product [Nesidiocoris tenuis]
MARLQLPSSTTTSGPGRPGCSSYSKMLSSFKAFTLLRVDDCVLRPEEPDSTEKSIFIQSFIKIFFQDDKSF